VDPDLLRRRELLAAGVTADEVRRLLHTGDLVAVRRGAYARRGTMPADPVSRHALQARAAVRELTAGAVVSHASAAVLHGLPLWNIPLTRVQVTRNRRSGARRTATLDVRAAALDADETVLVGPTTVTSAARTVADLARTVPFEQAVVVADAALHRGLVTRSDLVEALARAPHRPGNPRARRVVQFADGRSESVGESRSRYALHLARLPTPDLQWVVHAVDGAQLARVDFAWPAAGVVGEFDGRVKYGRSLTPGREPGEVVFAEKLREDAIRARGLRVVRWTWPDLQRFAPVVDRIRG
jgi:hypothetical protein